MEAGTQRGPETGGGPARERSAVEEGTDAIVRMADLDATGPTGAFVDRHGAVSW